MRKLILTLLIVFTYLAPGVALAGVPCQSLSGEAQAMTAMAHDMANMVADMDQDCCDSDCRCPANGCSSSALLMAFVPSPLQVPLAQHYRQPNSPAAIAVARFLFKPPLQA